MSLAAALAGLEMCEVVVTNRSRSVDGGGKGFGEIGTDAESQCVLEGLVTEKELESLTLHETGSLGVDEVKVFFQGRVDLKLEDTVKINDLSQLTYRVRKVRFRRNGNFTKAVLRNLTRRAVT